jgi:phage host-nuclease inhibitor protein Gam
MVDELDLYEDKPVDEHWTITDMGAADWALAKIARYQAEIDRRTTYANAMRAQLEAKIAEHFGPADKRDGDQISFFESHLKHWAYPEILRQPKGKTLELLNGKIKMRNIPVATQVTDEAEAFAYLEANHPECLRTPKPKPKEIDKAAVKALIESGVAVPGVELLVGRYVIEVEPDKPAIEEDK